MTTTMSQEENGVILYEYTPDHGMAWFGVADAGFRHFRVTFCPLPEGDWVSVGVDAEWSDEEPGELVNYAHDTAPRCGPDDTLTITDDGLLTAMIKAKASSTVDFRQGFTVQLPTAFVPFIRKAIELAFEKVAESAKERVAELAFDKVVESTKERVA